MSKTSKLSKRATADLINAVRTNPAQPPAMPQPPERFSEEWTSFETLPTLKRVRHEQMMGKAFGLEDPYYRLHDAMAGARSVVEGRAVLNFASYDYLGINGHPRIVEAVRQASEQWGTSVSASRLTAGERRFHRELEARLAALYEVPAALVFVGGHATNVGVIGDLMGARDLILHDALIHNSCIMGAILSGAARRAFAHNDLDDLERILSAERRKYQRVLIVTEGMFSMDGDSPDVARLVELKRRFGAWLMVDEAHALGVLGATGRGVHEAQGVAGADIDIWMGTLSKTTVSCGGYIAGSQALIDALRYGCPSQVFSVGMPPPAAAAASAALDLMVEEPERVARQQANGQLFLREARRLGLDVSTALGYGVLPVIVGDSVRTVVLAQRLFARGINAFPVLPPGVPEKSARLRFFLSAAHSEDDIRNAVAATAEELSRPETEQLSLGRLAELVASQQKPAAR